MIKSISCLHPHKESPSSQPSENKEEEKKNEEDHKPQYPHLPCFDLPEMSQIWLDGKIQFKKDKFILFGKEATVEGEWLNGKPHGICIYENEYSRGVMTFTHGKVDGGPCWNEIKEDGTRESCEYFDEEDPKGLGREYNNDKDTFNVTSTTNKQPAPGWLKLIGNNKGKQGMHVKQF